MYQPWFFVAYFWSSEISITIFCFQLIVARSEPDPDAEIVDGTSERGDIGIVGDDVQDIGAGNFSPAPGVETVCVFPKNPSKGWYMIYIFVPLSCFGFLLRDFNIFSPFLFLFQW